MSAPEEVSLDELAVVVARQAAQLEARDRQITEMAGRLAELIEVNEALAVKLARLEHLLSRNSGTHRACRHATTTRASQRRRRRSGATAGRDGRGANNPRRRTGLHLAWTDDPNERRDRFLLGRCDCGDDLARARDLGMVDRCQSHEIPQVAVRIIQCDQHQVRCRCGRTHTAARPDGARPGPVGYGPNLAAFAV